MKKTSEDYYNDPDIIVEEKDSIVFSEILVFSGSSVR